MISWSSELLHWWEYLYVFTVKEIKARYKKAIFGFIWILLNPLLQMLVIGFIFQFFVPVKVNNYFLFLFVGLLPWNFFSYSVTKNTPMILNERNLIKKAKFPRETIIISIILSNLFHLLISWFILFLALIVNKILNEHYALPQLIGYSLRLLLTLPILGWLTGLTVAFSLLFSALNVKYRDINFIVQAIMPLWFYATPVIFTLQILPKQFGQFLYINPVTGVVELLHAIILNQPVLNIFWVIVDFFVSVCFLVLSWYVFKREAKYFDDWI